MLRLTEEVDNSNCESSNCHEDLACKETVDTDGQIRQVEDFTIVEDTITIIPGPQSKLSQFIKFNKNTILTIVMLTVVPAALLVYVVLCRPVGMVRYSLKARFLLEAMDNMTDPCDDFYHFACGNWQRQNPIPADSALYDIFNQVRENVFSELKILLEDENISSSSASTDLMKHLYKKCMNIDEINKLKSGPLIEAIQTNYGWPLLGLSGSPKGSSVDFTDLLGRLRLNYGLEVFFMVDVFPDLYNSSTNTLWIKTGALTDNQLDITKGGNLLQDRSPFNGKNNITLKRSYLRLIATDLGLNITKEILALEEKILSFHAVLVGIENDKDGFSIKMTISELQKIVPFIDWFRYFKIIMPNLKIYKLINRPFLLIEVPSKFMEILQHVFDEAEDTLLQNYIIYRLVLLSSSYLDERFSNVDLDILREQYNITATRPRWKTCISDVEKAMGFALGVSYFRSYFNDETKKQTILIVNQLKETFRSIIESVDWMDRLTKKNAIAKIDAMTVHIGFDDIVNNRYLDDYYKNAKFTEEDNYFTLMRKLTAYEKTKKLNSLLIMYNRKSFSIDRLNLQPITDVNAYNKITNEMVINLAILREPFYNKDLPNAVNYGGIGFVIGHELTHSFDRTRLMFDEHGNIKSWWTTYSYILYLTKLSCFKQMFFNKENVNEDISDNNGIKIAFEAYRAITVKTGEEMKLPGLEHFTNDQLFFLSYASKWCGNINSEYAKHVMSFDSHSLNEKRVTLTLSNYKEFSKSFHCPVGSQMNPTKSFTIWDKEISPPFCYI